MKKEHSILKKNSDGFTLIELVIVILIMAILSAIAVGSYFTYVDKAEEAADYEVLSAVLTAAQATLAEEGQVETISVVVNDSKVSSITATVDVGGTFTLLGTSDDTDKSDIFESYYGDTSSIKLSSTDGQAGAFYSFDDSSWTLGKTE